MKIRNLLIITGLVMLLGIFRVSAEEIGFTWYLDDDTGLVCVSGIVGETAPETVVIPSEINGIKVIKIENAVPVDNLGSYKYKSFDLKGAKQLVIPEGVTDVPEFVGTENLETVTLPSTLTVLPSFAFAGAESLVSINLDGILSVSSDAFSGCKSLVSANLQSAKKIGYAAFMNCTSLRELTVSPDTEIRSATAIFGGALDGTSGVVINGYSKSKAEKYAMDNGIQFRALDRETHENKPFITVDGHRYYGLEGDAARLMKLGLMKGVSTSPDGRVDFDLARTPTRLEAVVMTVRLLGFDREASETAKAHPFTDVPEWADGYVTYAYKNGITNGVSDTFFGSEAIATPQMYLTFMLRCLGYSDSGENADFSWDNPWTLALEKGITERDGYYEIFLRKELVDMSKNTLTSTVADGEKRLCDEMAERGVFTKDELEYWLRYE